MIDLSLREAQLAQTIEIARQRGIYLPSFAQMKNPALLPEAIKVALREVGLWDINPLNLCRITWKNEPVSQGGGFNGVNYLEVPTEVTGVSARIIALVGKWFPTGAHKVGATYGCLVPTLVTGQFDPLNDRAVWPSTGNYCRGGAYNAALLGCESIAILPEGMSRERFEWLKSVAGEIIATPGTESNVKEIFDKVNELASTREDVFIFNQFAESGNHLWHYEVTGSAMIEVLEQEMDAYDEYRGMVVTTGSAGTIGAGDKMKEQFPNSKIGAGEALQCPTMLYNGFGAHRIEGIGDKHIPWIHNVRNTDMVLGIDDQATISLMRLFNEEAGKDYMAQQGVPADFLDQTELFGISGIANLLGAIKMVKHYGWGEHDIVLTVTTDSMELYQSRLEEESAASGPYTMQDAASDFKQYLHGVSTDHMLELDYFGRKRVHNLKYFTWIEQQGRQVEELEAQWEAEYWDNIHQQVGEVDRLIEDFNRRVGLYP